ncbi:MAG: prolipoprotein diacylglyceryl transferase [Acidimicrobiales bacterium]
MRPIPVAFHVGPLTVHTYGIGLAIAFWFAYRYLERRLGQRGYPTRWVFGVFIWTVVASVVGARAMHVLANLSYYQARPDQVLAVWHGGLSSWGGILLAAPTALLLIRHRCPKLRFGDAFDIALPVLACAWAIGRLLGPQLMVAGGGHVTHQWFGMYYAGQVGRRLPVPLFQAAEDLAIFAVMLGVERWVRTSRHRIERAHRSGATLRAPSGVVAASGMLLWGVVRALDEKLWLSYPGQLGDVLVEAAGLALAAAGATLLIVTWRRWCRWREMVVPDAASAAPASSETASLAPMLIGPSPEHSGSDASA